ncbi:biopolymer transporter ExbD [Calothrix sp. FACHB-1219]|uniref:ExbD/TolR family protein n=1 Tax=unclassified Calothrix TaxID=2619626 RepID=UPI001683FFA3|nr:MULTISPECIES: biopolymer transporter ExbD [unclassified Calothrix]MBD2201988.1 biopolymer transporter ExbD [Calothrix sp. FACHB-168]MBD2217024.1 biopolymer transporter ExbD [Calothrix sp. FACHB-1219]
MRLQDEADVPAQINIVPMIDVIFAILTFFIMSTLFLTRQEGLPVNLPQASTSQQSQVPTKITVTVEANGNISLNKKPTTVDALTEQLRGMVGSTPDTIVVINADRKVEHGEIVTIMDRVRQVKGARLAIATQKP